MEPTRSSPVRIRAAGAVDAERIAELAGHLGYPASSQQIRHRLEERGGDPLEGAFVAETENGAVAGWVEIIIGRSLLYSRRAHIAGLVVDQDHRRRGIGKLLMQKAEQWARQMGCSEIALRSNIIREEAHSFYRRLGYEHTKTQHAFRRPLKATAAQTTPDRVGASSSPTMRKAKPNRQSGKINFISLLLLCVAGATATALYLGIQAAQQQPGPPPLRITYIANEGFLLEAGVQKVLIDSLFRSGVAGYATVPADTREKLETAQPPFDGVELILVSHHHADHFDAAAVARHLESNPRTILLSSPQVTDPVRRALPRNSTAGERIQTVLPRGTQRIRRTLSGINVEVMNITHGRDDIQNLGHLITLGERKVLHIGDSEADATDFRRLRLAKDGVDVALLPGWYLDNDQGAQLVRDLIRPRHIIAMHLRPSEDEALIRRIQAQFPDAIVATAPLATQTYP